MVKLGRDVLRKAPEAIHGSMQWQFAEAINGLC